ncbi:hypothetical protein EJK17_03420 [Lactobacillus xujianguonis]|uniref:Uncharacterized protein n=1 Tax=Lactobacillus xujianguonis TaxID=2495899 RepID=A0A437SWG1_9LACO|nr:hypothetical protein [Lactobacillus xujianguonis]RVU71253.1 hypothetical protein EJK17_03420 [Lactobacillus xujianguonis]
MKYQQIRDFFKEDYPRLYLLSGSEVATRIDLNDKSRIGYYKNVLAITWLTIHKLENTPRHPYQTIIIEHHINHITMKDIIREIGYCKNATNKKHNEALSSFAEIFKQEQIKNKVYPLLEFE